MDEFIWHAVKDSPEMKELFSGEPRIYSDGGSRDDPVSPYIVWTNITEIPTVGVSNRSLSNKHRIQFDVYARNSSQARQIGKCLEEVFRGRGIPLLRMGPYPEAGTKLYRRTIDMSFIVKGN